MRIILNEKNIKNLKGFANAIYGKCHDMNGFDINKFVECVYELSDEEISALSQKYEIEIEDFSKIELEDTLIFEQLCTSGIRKLRHPTRIKRVLNINSF